MLNEILDKNLTDAISGEDAFRLNDTYGFPLDLTREIAGERGVSVDEEAFRSLMKAQKERARAARKNAGADAWLGESNLLEDIPETEFVGYESLSCQAKILAIVKDGQRVENALEGDEVVILTDRTPFYGESGGQVGDTGLIQGNDGGMDVGNTTKNQAKSFLHHGVVSAGILSVGEEVTMTVDTVRRNSIMRNHTAAHLLQAALRQVLGDHVEQAGQLVNERHVRFDFTHFSALTPEELLQVENLVNQEILKAVPVSVREMGIEEARLSGAMALFGEKYGDVVRVVSVEDGFSKELCGGTHMDNTARLGLFKILSESSVASGVRRIEGVTAMGVLDLLSVQMATLRDSARAMKVINPMELPLHAQQMMAQLKEKDKEIESLNAKLAQNRLDGVFQNAQEVDGVKVVFALLSGTGSDALRALCDKAKERPEAIVAVFAGVSGGKATLAAVCSKEAQQKGLKAGVLVKEVAQLCGGNGGGRPDFAMAGAKDQSKLDDALAAVPELVKKQLG